jgi:ATP-dependent Clp protease protease subunit
MSHNQHNYFRVLQGTSGMDPEIYLYGYIGQKAEPMFGEDPSEDITDIAVVKAIKDLERTNKRINIRINSPGGSVLHGDPIVTAIRNSKAEIHTYVDGIAASMGFDIWSAAKFRHASLNSKLMIHATGSFAFGTAKDLRAAAEMLDKFDQSAISTLAASTGMSEDDIRKEFYEDYADHWLTAKDALKMGLISEIEDYPTSMQVDNPEKYSYRQLLEMATRAANTENDGHETKETEEAKEADAAIEIFETWRADHLRRMDILISQTS